MTKSTITRERLEELAAGQSGFNLRISTLEESQQLARMALDALDTAPVGEFYEDGPLNWYQISDGDRVPAHRRIPLYRHAQQPVVPDGSYQQLSELYHAQEKRLFKIAQRIKGPAFDKYSHSPSQAIDVLEVAIFGEDAACRDAMLQAGTLTNEDTRQVDDLTMWIKRLVRSLKNSNPDSKLPREAMDYLTAKGLISVGDILR